jgi:hypothetical protein
MRWADRARRAAAVAVAGILAAGCELDPINVDEGTDRLVVEAVLRAGEPVQNIVLHRTIRGSASREAPGAVVTVSGSGREVRFVEVNPEECLSGAQARGRVSCYRSPAAEGAWVVSGAEYTLAVETPRGERAQGRTRVPGTFSLGVPGGSGGASCRIEPERVHRVTWGNSAGVATYVVEMKVHNLREALKGEGLASTRDSMVLVSIRGTAADTTVELPRHFFARGEIDEDDLALLRRLQSGLPEGVHGSLVVAAIDQNLNRSLRVITTMSAGYRVSSVSGDATGLFGSVAAVPVAFQVRGEGFACGEGRDGG